MARLIIVSNRVAVPEPGQARAAGGLTVAVDAALKSRDGIWFGWSGKVTDDADETKPAWTSRGNRSYVTLDLSEPDFNEYYNGFANRVIWPIFHYRVDLAEFSSTELGGYLRVNRRFADALSALLAPDDLVWIHDYHLMPLAGELRARGHVNPMGFFLHTPFPPADIVRALPQHAETAGALIQYDLVGVQTEQDAANVTSYFASLGASHRRGAERVDLKGRSVRVRAFPVGIATSVYARAARCAVRSPVITEFHESLGGRQAIIGVDRLDYSKGIPQRIRAFGEFLERSGDWLNKVSMLQITPKSRVEVPEYVDIDREVSGLVGQINGRYGDASWTPIRYVNRSYSRATLAGLFRLARVGLVTPLRDGMNLVAKEYVAAQDPDDPGVLVLSQFAGAAEKLDGALTVNPHESEAVASAIATALAMDPSERRDRHRRMLDYLLDNDIGRWAADYLADLGSKPGGLGLLGNLRRLFALRSPA